MKYILLVIIFRQVVFADITSSGLNDAGWPPKGLTDLMVNSKQKCQEESKVTEASIQYFSKGPADDIRENDHNLKCYVFCLSRTAGVMNDKGEMDVTKAMEQLERLDQSHQTIVLKAGAKCTRLKKNPDPCQVAFNLYKCMKIADPKHFILL